MDNKIFSYIVGTKSYNIKINNIQKNITNTNELLGNLEGVYGIKTGFTNGANRCLVSSCRRNNMDIICVVLGADTKKFRTSDSIKLINYTFENFKPVNIEKITNEYFNKWLDSNKNYFSIEKSLDKKLDFIISNLEYNIIPIKKSNIDNLKIEINCNHIFKAPIKSNTILGNITIKDKNNTIATCNIINKNNIKKKNILNYFFEFIKNYSLYIKNSI